MGYDWYYIANIEAYGVLIPNKQIKEAQKPGSSSSRKAHSDDPLDSDTTNWLFDQMAHLTGDYCLFDIANAFVFIAKGDVDYSGDIEVVGPYDIVKSDHKFVIKLNTDFLPRRDGEHVYENLVQMAQRMTLQTEKLSFEPGLYRFTGTSSFPMEEYCESDMLVEKAQAAYSSQELQENVVDQLPLLQQDDLSTDLTIVVGQGEHQKTYQVNQSVLREMVPGFESYKEVNANGSTLHCSDLEPWLFEAVIGHYTTRFPVRETTVARRMMRP